MRSQSHLTGYRPVTTREIGKKPPSSVVPVNLLPADETADDADDEPPPYGGWNAHSHYGPSEVLLESFAAVRDASKIHPLDPPQTGTTEKLHAFDIRFTPSHLLTLKHPTILRGADGRDYEFTGFRVLTHQLIRMPPMQFLCGGELVDVELVPTELPYTVLHPSAEERMALSELHDLLWGELLGVRDNFMGVDDDGSRHLHFWPVFTFCGAVERSQPSSSSAEVEAEAEEEADEAAVEAAAAADAAEAMAASWDELDDESFGRREPSSPLASRLRSRRSSPARPRSVRPLGPSKSWTKVSTRPPFCFPLLVRVACTSRGTSY